MGQWLFDKGDHPIKETTFETGVPFLLEGRVEVSVEGSYIYAWGDSITTEDNVNYQVPVEIPPKKKVKLSLQARQGTCDVPFSYIQIDTYHRRHNHKKDHVSRY
ncbi:hypothetical protein ACFX2I_008736 [Malus domestica]